MNKAKRELRVKVAGRLPRHAEHRVNYRSRSLSATSVVITTHPQTW